MTSPMLPPFLRIAGELRNEIYKLLLLRPIPIDPFYWRTRILRPGHRIDTAILRVNKHINQEASSILYGLHRFDLWGLL